MKCHFFLPPKTKGIISKTCENSSLILNSANDKHEIFSFSPHHSTFQGSWETHRHTIPTSRNFRLDRGRCFCLVQIVTEDSLMKISLGILQIFIRYLFFFFLFPLHSFQWYNVVEETHSQLLTALDNQAQFQSWMSFTGQEFYSP